MVLPFRSSADVESAVGVVARHLQRGGLLAHPTETIYGLGSRAVDADVLALMRLKSGREGKPFLLLVSSREMAMGQGLEFNRSAQALADRFWPGPLTLVLPGGEGLLPDSLRGPEGGVAVRWTSHAGMSCLIERLGYPVTSTSANRSGAPAATGSEAIVTEFGEAVEGGTLLVLDGGVLSGMLPSTVIDCTTPVPRAIREGVLPLRDLGAAVEGLDP